MKLAWFLIVFVAACGGPAIADNAPIEPAGTVSFGSDSPTTTTIPASSTTVSTVAGVSATEQAPTPERLIATGPDAELIAFEAQWLCDVQRHTFDSPGAVDEDLSANLAEAGLTRTRYDGFKEGLSADAASRKQVLDLFVQDCS